jgi:hypothetical protein
MCFVAVLITAREFCAAFVAVISNGVGLCAEALDAAIAQIIPNIAGALPAQSLILNMYLLIVFLYAQ